MPPSDSICPSAFAVGTFRKSVPASVGVLRRKADFTAYIRNDQGNIVMAYIVVAYIVMAYTVWPTQLWPT